MNVYLVRLQYNDYEQRVLGIASDLQSCKGIVEEYLTEYGFLDETIDWYELCANLPDQGYTIYFEEVTVNKFMENL